MKTTTVEFSLRELQILVLAMQTLIHSEEELLGPLPEDDCWKELEFKLSAAHSQLCESEK